MNTFNNEVIGTPQEREQIEEEAGLWIARIDGRALSKDETRDLLVWVKRSDYHREYLYRLAAQWDRMGCLEKLSAIFPLVEPAQASDTDREDEGIHGWFGFPGGPVYAMASLVLIICVGILVLAGIDNTSTSNIYVAGIGDSKRIELADGSSMILNTNTRVEVEYQERERKIVLLHGEALFEVEKDRQRPFRVYASQGVVQAVGTAFNVRLLDGDRVNVIVTEGVVNVVSDEPIVSGESTPEVSTQEFQRGVDVGETDKGAPMGVYVKAGQALTYTDVDPIAEAVPLAEKDLEKYLAWSQGSLVFDGESLAQVIEEISRYTDKTLVVSKPELAQLKVGGRFKTDDIDNLIWSLGEVMELKVSYLSADEIIFSEKQ